MSQTIIVRQFQSSLIEKRSRLYTTSRGGAETSITAALAQSKNKGAKQQKEKSEIIYPSSTMLFQTVFKNGSRNPLQP